ncbi:MAG TPA: M28 family peptidase [Caulobacteraceae bacterium]|jgi:hypothetical protein|nr:M28 family peptidase [Caulobacteraceae bacterium]
MRSLNSKATCLFVAALATVLASYAPVLAGDRGWSDGVARQFRASGLAPGAGRSYLQPLRLKQQSVTLDRSSAVLDDGVVAEALALGTDLRLAAGAAQPDRVAAPLFFLGSREPGPAMLHELQGKVVVMIDRDAAAMDPASRMALERSGAVGFLTVPSAPAAAAEAPAQDAVYLADEAAAPLTATVGAEAAARLFARSGRDYAHIVALVRAGRTVPSFALDLNLKASLTIQTRSAASANVVGVVRGTDPLLAREYVVISADASAAGSVLDAARRFHDAAMRPKRSVVFAVFAPEQHGAPGARAFAARPPVPREDVVASLSATVASAAADATLAIQGGEETSLGASARDLAAGARLSVASTAPTVGGGQAPYRLLEAGIPAVLLSFGGAGADGGYLLALALQVADNDAHPAWVRGSRFAPRAPQAQEMLTVPVEMPLGRRRQKALDVLARSDVPEPRLR